MTINEQRPYTWTSADAAGLPVLVGLVRYDEVAAGAINRALRFTVPLRRKHSCYLQHTGLRHQFESAEEHHCKQFRSRATRHNLHSRERSHRRLTNGQQFHGESVGTLQTAHTTSSTRKPGQYVGRRL
jgi:hypothetical protein